MLMDKESSGSMNGPERHPTAAETAHDMLSRLQQEIRDSMPPDVRRAFRGRIFHEQMLDILADRAKARGFVVAAAINSEDEDSFTAETTPEVPEEQTDPDSNMPVDDP